MRQPSRLFLFVVFATFVHSFAIAAEKKVSSFNRTNSFSEALSIKPLACTVDPISCGSLVEGFLRTSDCLDSNDSYTRNYVFTGTAGQMVRIDLISPNPGQDIIDPFLTLYMPNGTFFMSNDDADDDTLNSRLQAILPVSGQWLIAVASSEPRDTGEYDLMLSCVVGDPAPCTQGPSNLCLSGGRFRVSTTWTTTTGQTGAGRAVRLTDDTGYFWFFNDTNVEIVTKVLNACSFANSIWVFSAGLTNVEVTMTVNDTQTGTAKIYRNPLGTAYQPIQDTSAFTTCP